MTETVNQDRFPAQWALDLLEYDPRIQHGVLQKYIGEWLAATTGCLAPVLYNRYRSRPYFAGWPVILLSTAATTAVAHLLGRFQTHRNLERDETFRQYIRLHPELFPEPKRQKYADVFEPWVPIR